MLGTFINVPTINGNASLSVNKFTSLSCCMPKKEGMLLMFDGFNVLTTDPTKVKDELEKIVKAEKTSTETRISKHLSKILNKNIKIVKDGILKFKITFDDLDAPMVSTNDLYSTALARFAENREWDTLRGFEGTAEVEISVVDKKVLLNVSGYISNDCARCQIEQKMFTHTEKLTIREFIYLYHEQSSFIFDKNGILCVNNCELASFSLNGFYLYNRYAFTTTTSNFITESAEAFRQAKMTRELKTKQIQKDYEGRIAIANALMMLANATRSVASATSGVARATAVAGINVNRGSRGLESR